MFFFTFLDIFLVFIVNTFYLRVSVDFFVFKLVWVFLVGYGMDSMIQYGIWYVVRYGMALCVVWHGM